MTNTMSSFNTLAVTFTRPEFKANLLPEKGERVLFHGLWVRLLEKVREENVFTETGQVLVRVKWVAEKVEKK